MDDLEPFAPDPVTVALCGQKVEVRAVTLRRLKPYRELAALAREAMAEEDMLGALADRAEAVNHRLAACLDLPPERIDTASLPEVYLALCAVLRVNSDFLAGPVMGALIQGTAMLIAPAPDGVQSSPGSSDADTGLTTPST